MLQLSACADRSMTSRLRVLDCIMLRTRCLGEGSSKNAIGCEAVRRRRCEWRMHKVLIGLLDRALH